MSESYHIIGNYLSPYVRKVLVVLEMKGLPYSIDPIAPFVGNERFGELSPLRRIPVLIEGERVLNDSSVICQYLEERHPTPALYPADLWQRAQARWLEEYADSYLGEVAIWGLFFQKGVKRILFGEPPDEEVMRRAREQQLPAALDYLEPRLPASGFLFGAAGIADISLGCFFRNAAFVRYPIDAARWPGTAAWLERVLALPAFRKLAVLEDATLRVPLPEQRAVLAGLGAPVSPQTLGTAAPRRGPMRRD
ncbi:MAG: glutathione S-transferase family protein [Proteobacteria bacterium]|nr:glutathione S-transferase family protein [Pseudomonadota bacterium]